VLYKRYPTVGVSVEGEKFSSPTTKNPDFYGPRSGCGDLGVGAKFMGMGIKDLGIGSKVLVPILRVLGPVSIELDLPVEELSPRASNLRAVWSVIQVRLSEN